MEAVKATIEVARPAGDVFAFLTEVENEPQWREGIQSVTIERGSPGEPGLVYKEAISRMGIEIELEVEVTEVELDRRLAYTFSGGLFKGNGVYEITTNDGRCRVTATVDLGFGMMAKAMSAMMGPQLELDLQQLKTALEAGDAE